MPTLLNGGTHLSATEPVFGIVSESSVSYSRNPYKLLLDLPDGHWFYEAFERLNRSPQPEEKLEQVPAPGLVRSVEEMLGEGDEEGDEAEDEEGTEGGFG